MLVEGGLVTRLSNLKLNKVTAVGIELHDAIASTHFLCID